MGGTVLGRQVRQTRNVAKRLHFSSISRFFLKRSTVLAPIHFLLLMMFHLFTSDVIYCSVFFFLILVV